MVRGSGISSEPTFAVICIPDNIMILLGKFKTKRGGGRSFRSVQPSFYIDAKSSKR